jgi:hypothetical protein
MISVGNPDAFVSDLFDVPEALKRRGPRFVPAHVWPAMLFGQQIKMKLQLFIYFTLSSPAVQISK